MTFKTEFPDFPEADFPALPESFDDVSWHNDLCPCIVSDKLGLQIWIDYADPAQRDFPEAPRYSVQNQTAGVETGTGVLDTDDWAQVLAVIEQRQKS